MPRYEETNVRVPLCAFDALGVIAASRAISRDEAARRVLRDHMEAQEQREPEDRLTHISVVLRYPRPPRWQGDPRMDRPLRLRLDPGLAARARAVSLQLPGQSPRAHRDYQARLLTGAMVTAISVQQPFEDAFLAGLAPLLRHGAATGLWQLAVAATSTRAENAVLDAAVAAMEAEETSARRRLLLIAEALNEDVAWHSPARFTVAESIARDLLTGPRADVNEQMLYEKASEWDKMRQALRADSKAAIRYRRGLTSYDWSGRGGSAVWRAERKVEVQDFEEWLIRPSADDGAERRVSPPGWQVRVPEGWSAKTWLNRAGGVPEPFAAWAADGRVLVIPAGSRHAAWPLTRSQGAGGSEPVPGLWPLLAAAGRLPPDQVSGYIEAILVDWSAEQDDSESLVRLLLPAHDAFRLGFIDAEERRLAMAEARAETLKMMTEIVDSLPLRGLTDRQADLLQAMSSVRRFREAAAELGIEFSIVKATWTWPGRSAVEEFLAGARAEAVQWLAGWAHKTCGEMLQRSMERAWRSALAHVPAEYWVPSQT